MVKLRECPFCGGEAELVDCEANPRWFVKCPKRCCEQSKLYMDKASAIKAWNKRAETEAPFDHKEFRQFLNDKAWEIASRRKEEKDERTD